jgi:hypothetical protein
VTETFKRKKSLTKESRKSQSKAKNGPKTSQKQQRDATSSRLLNHIQGYGGAK